MKITPVFGQIGDKELVIATDAAKPPEPTTVTVWLLEVAVFGEAQLALELSTQVTISLLLSVEVVNVEAF